MLIKCFFITAITCTRLSLIHLYWTLVRDSAFRVYKIFLVVMIFYILSLWVTSLCLAIFICRYGLWFGHHVTKTNDSSRPVKAYWAFPIMTDRVCISEGATNVTLGILNCVADFTVVYLPVPIVRTLTMPIRLRIAVLSILCVGCLTGIAGIVRVVYSWKLIKDSIDMTWDIYPIWVVTSVEINIGLVRIPLWRNRTKISAVMRMRSRNPFIRV